MKVLIGIDDTDNPDTIGTGRLSRMLAAELESAGLISDCEATRHQFLVDDAIPYTSHNSSACLAAERHGTPEEIAAFARAFLEKHEHADANPGLCVIDLERVPESFVALGRRAQRQVLDPADAQALGRDSQACVWWTGETGQGAIGALGGTGLRSSGADGRFILLRGIRELLGTLRVSEILERSAVARVEDEAGTALRSDELVDTLDWVRPSLLDGQPVYRVRRLDGRWQPAERRKRDE